MRGLYSAPVIAVLVVIVTFLAIGLFTLFTGLLGQPNREAAVRIASHGSGVKYLYLSGVDIGLENYTLEVNVTNVGLVLLIPNRFELGAACIALRGKGLEDLRYSIVGSSNARFILLDVNVTLGGGAEYELLCGNVWVEVLDNCTIAVNYVDIGSLRIDASQGPKQRTLGLYSFYARFDKQVVEKRVTFNWPWVGEADLLVKAAYIVDGKPLETFAESYRLSCPDKQYTVEVLHHYYTIIVSEKAEQ